MSFYSYGDHHESFYEHGCSIIHEKDVLQTDIPGNTWLVSFKRWWHDLFLLCYTDKRTRLYYNSSHAMKVERMKNFRRHKNCIHPLSKFRIFWDAFILAVILLYKILFHYNSSIIACSMPLVSYFVGVFLECILLLDVYINTRCGYIDTTTRMIVLDLHKAFQHYCSTKLFIHVVSAIPLHSIMFLRYGLNIECVECKSNLFNCTIVLVGLFSLIRIYEASSYWKKERNSFNVTCFFRFLRIVILGLMTMVEFITFADTVSMLTFLRTGYIDTKQYFSIVLTFRFKEKGLPNLYLFIHDLYRTFKSFLIFNFGFNLDSLYMGKMFYLATSVLASVFYMWGIFEAFLCVSRQKFTEDEIIHNKGAIIRLAKCRQLPDKICLKLRQYYDFNMTMQKIVEKQNGLYQSLPTVLKKEILLNCYSRILMRIPYFSEWPMKLIEILIFALKEETYLQQDVVAEAGVQGDGLVVVDAGVMAVYSSDHREVGHLIDGDYFGELSLVTDKEIRTSYIVAVTSCKVVMLEKKVFRQYMRDYPGLFSEMKRQLRSKYSRSAEVQSSSSNENVGFEVPTSN